MRPAPALSLEALVVADLRAGLGVEDVARRHAEHFVSIHAAERYVRGIVAYLRGCGALKPSFFAPLRGRS